MGKRESPEEENVLNIQLAVFIDRSLVNSIHPWFYGEAKIGQVIKNMTEVLVESVELQLNHRTLGQNFTIEIVHLETGISLPGLEEEIDWRSRDLDVASLSELYLKTFCLWQSEQKIPGQRHWDYAVLLTGPGLYRWCGREALRLELVWHRKAARSSWWRTTLRLATTLDNMLTTSSLHSRFEVKRITLEMEESDWSTPIWTMP